MSFHDPKREKLDTAANQLRVPATRRPEYMKARPVELPSGEYAYDLAQKCNVCGEYSDGALMPNECPSCGQPWRQWVDDRPPDQRGR